MIRQCATIGQRLLVAVEVIVSVLPFGKIRRQVERGFGLMML
jgi:hypothetical protein